jgi:hypothetical protein
MLTFILFFFCYYIVTCFDTRCTLLQVILTPTFHVSGYLRQVIKVDVLLRRLCFIWTALPTVITLITIISLGTYNTSSWYIFLWDDATPLVHLSALMTAVCLSLLTRLLHWTASFYYSASIYYCLLFTDCSPFITLDLLHRRHHVQLFHCRLSGLIVVRAGLLFVERFPRQRSIIFVT